MTTYNSRIHARLYKRVHPRVSFRRRNVQLSSSTNHTTRATPVLSAASRNEIATFRISSTNGQVYGEVPSKSGVDCNSLRTCSAVNNVSVIAILLLLLLLLFPLFRLSLSRGGRMSE